MRTVNGHFYSQSSRTVSRRIASRSALLLSLMICTLFAPKSFSAPVLELAASKIDVGSVIIDEPQSVEFEVRNSGNEALRLELKSVSCGCTAGKIPDSVPPGGKATLKFTYSRPRVGSFAVSAFLVCNDPARDGIILQFSGVGIRAVSINPTEVSLGPVAVGQEAPVRFVVRQEKKGAKIAIRSVTGAKNIFALDAPKALPTLPATEQVVSGRIRVPQEGEFRTVITIRTNDVRFRILELPITAVGVASSNSVVSLNHVNSLTK